IRKTYEPASIEKWLKAGHKRCPSAKEFLSITSLTPNHALRSLISDWHKVNGLKLLERSSSSDQGMVMSTDYAEDAGHDILLSKLTSDKSEDRRSTVGELYYLHEDSYSILIPRLVACLFSHDIDTQNDAIAILRKLSFGVWDSRHCIISSNAVPGILYVLENGSMKARGDAAHTFWSLLTLINDKSIKIRIRIGIRKTLDASRDIPALVKLLKDGGHLEKTDSARAFSDLCKYKGH
ncbi:u-box domain-containing protein 12, partial [Quercus suber]